MHAPLLRLSGEVHQTGCGRRPPSAEAANQEVATSAAKHKILTLATQQNGALYTIAIKFVARIHRLPISQKDKVLRISNGDRACLQVVSQ